MLEQTLTTVSETATAALQAFLLPGELLLTLIDRIAPQTAAIMTFGNGGTIILFMLALLSWTLVLIAILPGRSAPSSGHSCIASGRGWVT